MPSATEGEELQGTALPRHEPCRAYRSWAPSSYQLSKAVGTMSLLKAPARELLSQQ